MDESERINRPVVIIANTIKGGVIVTAEEHSLIGGLGSAVAEILVNNRPVPMLQVGIKDTFAESGDPDSLMEKYGLTVQDIIKTTIEAIKCGLKPQCTYISQSSMLTGKGVP